MVAGLLLFAWPSPSEQPMPPLANHRKKGTDMGPSDANLRDWLGREWETLGLLCVFGPRQGSSGTRYALFAQPSLLVEI
jgi:hypothetical protein